jgi:uncharacterized 2Fe-2S/4Fe-4S cluster protein (DUF4445 family)
MNQAGAFPVLFLPAMRSVDAVAGEQLLVVARREGIRITADCGGLGRCRSCVVRLEGNVPAAGEIDLAGFSREEVAMGWRRACQVRLTGKCSVHVPALTAPPALVSRREALSSLPIERPVLLRGANDLWVRGDRAVGPIPGGLALGMAVDLGTTNIEASLADMTSGEVLSTAVKENPQAVFGADVITRMTHALEDPAEARELQRAAVDAIAELAGALTSGRPESVAEIAVVGNTVMHHLLLGLPLGTMARAPYAPWTLEPAELPAADLGLLLAPGAWLYAGPNIGGFIGSDHVAALMAALGSPPPEPWLLLDVGTNTEITLLNHGRMLSASCASGPAFEGGMLTCGMRAAPGAIAKVRMERDALTLHTVDDEPPVGICGSGVLSLLSELCKSGAVNSRGRLDSNHPRVRQRGAEREFVLAENESGALPVVFTQCDVRAVQMAKAAIRAGVELILAEAGLKPELLSRVVLAGIFGKYIDVEAALAIGLLPPLPRNLIVQAGNAAAIGARRLLVCGAARRRGYELARGTEYVELASRPAFRRTFARSASL